MAFKQRTYTEVPADENMSPQIREFLAALLSQVNGLSGQGPAQSGTGGAALSSNSIDPTTGQIVSKGNRVASVATEILFDGGAGGSTTIKFFWDGVNGGSQMFKIARDDGTILSNPGGTASGSPLTVTGLVTATTYFFYPYFDEGLQKIVFYSDSTAKGSPPIAFLSQSLKGAQAQIMPNRLQLAILVATTGIKTGGGTGSGGQGGGGTGGGRGGKGPLQ